jgi:uncharacterized protein (DUF488 family)
MMNIYTMGYEGQPFSIYLERLKYHSVTILVDVRLNPISRKKGFSKKSLTERLATEEIKYVHIPALGNPKEIRAEYYKNGDSAFLYENYKHYLELHPEAITTLLDTIKNEIACLMCFEKDWKLCHRGAIAEYLKEIFNIDVQHL